MTTTFWAGSSLIAAVLDETTRRKGRRAIGNSGQFRKNLTTYLAVHRNFLSVIKLGADVELLSIKG
jgi:hypothetical protein